ncbi:hypothetical protein FSP39_013790 [Pinctada imbricata]|uniref:Uncharacterized protein n=1 Tax=Pinctada imbricata TaxID=66713 RepID=A0AA89C1Q3_PINIB|nr:hypothetical protein FSP39_012774 [Pinctada imbricata]KAK3102766.1 hypothetical protein FSP39_013790 [Pinctada imbricata]
MSQTSEPSSKTSGKRTSIGADPGDPSENLALIRDDLREMKDRLKMTVTTDDVEKMVEAIVRRIIKKSDEERQKIISDEVEKKYALLKEDHDKTVDKLRRDADKAYSDIEVLREKLVDSKKEIRELTQRVIDSEEKAGIAYSKSNRNEQYSRKTNFKLYGVKESKGEDTEKIVIETIDKKADLKVDRNEILAVHRIPGKPGKERPILVKMRNSACKTKVMRKRSVLKRQGGGVTLADDVTDLNAKLINRLSRHSDIEAAWYFNGFVYGQYKGNRIRFDILDSIDEKLRSHDNRGRE